MRIIAEIAHPRLKISIFKMNDKLSIKFEKNLIEHIIKLRDGSSLNDVQKLKESINPEVIQKIEVLIDQEVQLRSQLEEKQKDDDFPEFEEII